MGPWDTRRGSPSPHTGHRGILGPRKPQGKGVRGAGDGSPAQRGCPEAQETMSKHQAARLSLWRCSWSSPFHDLGLFPPPGDPDMVRTGLGQGQGAQRRGKCQEHGCREPLTLGPGRPLCGALGIPPEQVGLENNRPRGPGPTPRPRVNDTGASAAWSSPGSGGRPRRESVPGRG